MMFDWIDHGQAGGTIWGEISESEDHIVPNPKGTEENTLFNFGEYIKKQRNDEAGAVVRPTEQTTGAKSDFSACDLENSSTTNASEELSAPRLDIDSWPDLPALNTAFTNGYPDKNYRDAMSVKLVNDFREADNLSKERVQLDGEPEQFSNGHEDKDNDCFLDCDWSNFGDFDLDRIFRNDPTFGHDMVGNGDEFPSPSTDVVNSTAQSIPMPYIPLNRDEFSDQDYSSFQFVEHSGRKRKSEEKTADSSVRIRDQTVRRSHLSCAYQGSNNQCTEKEDKRKKLLRPWKKAKEKSKNEYSQNLKCAWSHDINHSSQSLSPNFHASATLPTFQLPTISQQGQVGDVEPMGHLGSFNQPMFFGHGKSHLSAFPLGPNIHAGRNQIKPITNDHKLHPDPLKYSNYLVQVPDVISRPLTMTPREKIEKLRRRQQMQAMLAIKQQQHHFGHQITVTNNLVSQECSQKNQNLDAVTNTIGVEGSANKLLGSDVKMLVEQNDSQISALVDDPYLEETIYYELQDALGKLDPRSRLIIRDSLCRLARSAVKRQSASDRNSTNKSNRNENKVPEDEQTSNRNRCTGVPDAEADTNPIDRTVAHLLFYRPSDQCSRQDDVPRSPMSCNTAPQVPLVTHGCKSEGPEDFEGMEVQTSICRLDISERSGVPTQQILRQE